MFEKRGMWEDSGSGWEDHVHEDGSQRYCFGGGGKTNTVSTVQVPAWVSQAGTDNYNYAKAISAAPYQGYQGERVAGMNSYGQDTANRVAAMQGTGAGYAQNAMQATALNGAYTPQQVQTQFDPSQISALGTNQMDRASYLNPYLSEVRDTGLAALEQQRQTALNRGGDAAQAAGAFGGGRHGVMEGVTNANSAMAAGQLAAQIGAQGYDAASGLMTSDANRAMAAAQSNQAAQMQAMQMGQNAQSTNANLGLAANQQRLAAAQQYGNLAAQGQEMTARELSMQDIVAQQYRGIEQAQYDTAYQNWLDEYNHRSGLTGLGIRQSALGMSPYGQSTNTQQNGGGGSTAGTIIGGTMAAASLASALSDPKTKKHMKRVGRDEESGLGIWAFRYKGDPDNSAKVVGLNAAEVEKKYPDAVQKFDDGKGGQLRSILFDELPSAGARALAAGKALPKNKGVS